MEDESVPLPQPDPPSIRGPGRACSECNRKKTKCDMTRPVCGLCSRTGRTCIVPARRRPPLRGRHDPSKVNKNAPNIELLNRLLDTPHATTPLHPEDTWGSSPSPSLSQQSKAGDQRSLYGLNMEAEDRTSSTRPTNTASDFSTSLPMNTSSKDTIHISSHSPGTIAKSPEGTKIDHPCDPSRYSYMFILRLVSIHFQRIQPWLPLLHKPKFMSRLAEKMQGQPDPLSCLDTDEALLLSSIFTLSCRFLSQGERGGHSTKVWIDVCAHYARQCYKDARNIENPTLAYLQGCILLAFHYYTSGLSSQGWILVGVCLRLTDELGLARIDSEVNAEAAHLEWAEQEERRRAWWLVWELDVFGSSVCQRSFSTEWRRASVKLPVRDDFWFACQETDSPRLPRRLGSIWLVLDSLSRKDGRTWFLLANLLHACAQEYLQQEDGVSIEDRTVLQNEINCLKLALPSFFDLTNQPMDTDELHHSNRNWVIGTHLLLSSSTYISRNLPIRDFDASIVGPGLFGGPSGLRDRIFELSRITSQWPADYTAAAHPFFSCMMLNVYVPNAEIPFQSDLVSSCDAVVRLLQARLGEYWQLGILALSKCIFISSAEQRTKCRTGISKLQNSPTPPASADMELIKRYPLWFPRTMQWQASAAFSNSSIRQQQSIAGSETVPQNHLFDNVNDFASTIGTRDMNDVAAASDNTATRSERFAFPAAIASVDFWDLNLDNNPHDFSVGQDISTRDTQERFLPPVA